MKHLKNVSLVNIWIPVKDLRALNTENSLYLFIDMPAYLYIYLFIYPDGYLPFKAHECYAQCTHVSAALNLGIRPLSNTCKSTHPPVITEFSIFLM